MLTTIATVLAGLVGAAVILMGARALWAPQDAAGFGIPDTPTESPTFRAWLAVKSVRDVSAGIVILAVLAGGTAHLLGWALLAATVIPVGDAVIVLRSGGPKAVAYGVHAATAAVMLVISLLLLLA
ncbi:DUF4267 domain-containing protein [Nonomuraea sp. NPDC050790]|uniref:DUF4267 domain-containing protein n=1 Tax=Nonomuraea sp. NPDC050790 TaxID=3364371 RepID=UPI003788ACB4